MTKKLLFARLIILTTKNKKEKEKIVAKLRFSFFIRLEQLTEACF